MGWLYACEGGRLGAYERRIAEAAAVSVVCTQEEARTLQGFASPRRLAVVENGIDLERHSFRIAAPERPCAVFVGAMDYLANVDACEWFVRDVLPLVVREVPSFQLRIVGRHPSRRVQALHDGERVVVTGAVPQVHVELHAASVSIAPLRVARGVQNKVLEAFAAGTPVVATSAAAKGIVAQPGEHLLVADDPQAFAREVVLLIRDRDRAALMARAARALVERRYRWPENLTQLDALIADAAKRDKSVRHQFLTS
jgi:glycosyltransferase involved in cell wall biosynthesis